MTGAEIIAQAVEVSERVREAHRHHAFAEAVREFRHLLVRVPDLAADDFSDDQVGALSALAEGVIDQIEDRVAGDPSDSGNQKLVSGIYEIRRRLEKVQLWHSHYRRD